MTILVGRSGFRQLALAAAVCGAVALVLQLLAYGAVNAFSEPDPQAAIVLAPVMLALLVVGTWAGVHWWVGIPRGWAAGLGGVLGWMGIQLIPVLALVELALSVELGLAAIIAATTLAAAAGAGIAVRVVRPGPVPQVSAGRG